MSASAVAIIGGGPGTNEKSAQLIIKRLVAQNSEIRSSAIGTWEALR
jgi:hypothetical protein